MSDSRVEVTDVRTTAQALFMDSLISQIAALDTEAGSKARAYTDGMTQHGKWTAGRSGTASVWIDRMRIKLATLRASTPVTKPAVQAVKSGRYAVEEDGVLRFFKVRTGHRQGFIFLDVQASDEWHSIRSVERIRKVMALIARDPKEAMVRYGHELGVCGRCGRTLTDEESRAAGIGPICAGK